MERTIRKVRVVTLSREMLCFIVSAQDDNDRPIIFEEKSMKQFVCHICGYVYDPAVGDPDSGIAPGTPFESIPDDWVCPVCGATKSNFSPLD